jgi:hypothetical protein
MKDRASKRLLLSLETLESRSLATMVFLLGGNAFAQATATPQTRNAAVDLASRGDQPIQVSYRAMNSPLAFNQVANQIRRISQGQPIGLIGFSAGGTIALRLASVPGLNVKAVLNFYGPPDLSDWLNEHVGDAAYRRVAQIVGRSQRLIQQLSGPSDTTAHVVSVFGLQDRTVLAAPSTASFQMDFPGGAVYYYAGTHGVNIRANYGAYEQFLADLQ